MKEIETSGESKKLVLVVDDNSLALDITREALSDLYTVATVLSAKEMFEFLEHTKPELILLDIDMPEMNGFEAMRLLKRNSKYNLIPVS
ncbi:MAG: response regulator, partial [Oscillospiraceae bacterium]|nr:response regulator [Oscillospiraceae bacterium]